jgi:hypothetical protein
MMATRAVIEHSRALMDWADEARGPTSKRLNSYRGDQRL